MLLYNGQEEGGDGDFVSFGLSDGYPEFRFNLGGSPAVIRSRRAVTLDEWHTVRLQRDRATGETADGARRLGLHSRVHSSNGSGVLKQLTVSVTGILVRMV